jgi:hypothetical protein
MSFSEETRSLEEVRSQIDAWKRAVRTAPAGSMPIAPPTMPRYVRFAGITYDLMIGIHATIVRRIMNEGGEAIGQMFDSRRDRAS